MGNQGTALNGIIHLGGMKAQRAHVASVQDASQTLAIVCLQAILFRWDFHTKGMGCIVDDLQAILVGDVLNCLGVAWFAIDMHRHYRRCPWRNGSLNLVWIHIACSRVNVNKHWLATVPPDTMRGCHEAIRCRYHLASDTERLQSCHQRQSAIGEEAHVWYLQVLGESSLQLLVVTAIIGYPLAVPNLLQLRREVVKIRKKWRCYCY